jgi:hypothetical protein
MTASDSSVGGAADQFHPTPCAVVMFPRMAKVSLFPSRSAMHQSPLKEG